MSHETETGHKNQFWQDMRRPVPQILTKLDRHTWHIFRYMPIVSTTPMQKVKGQAHGAKVRFGGLAEASFLIPSVE